MKQATQKLIQLTQKQVQALIYENYRALNPLTVEEFMTSIREVGVRVPITVVQDGAALKIVDGHHRVEAVKRLTVDYPHVTISVRALVSDYAKDKVGETSTKIQKVISNFSRRENIVDRASAYNLLREAGKTPKQIAEAVGKEKSGIEAHLHFYKMYVQFKDEIDSRLDELKDAFLYKLAAKFARDSATPVKDLIEKELAPKGISKTPLKLDAEAALIAGGYTKTEAKKICVVLRSAGCKI